MAEEKRFEIGGYNLPLLTVLAENERKALELYMQDENGGKGAEYSEFSVFEETGPGDIHRVLEGNIEEPGTVKLASGGLHGLEYDIELTGPGLCLACNGKLPKGRVFTCNNDGCGVEGYGS